MKGEEKKKNGNKHGEILSKGVILLVLLMLAAQFGYFIVYVFKDLREVRQASVCQDSVQRYSDSSNVYVEVLHNSLNSTKKESVIKSGVIENPYTPQVRQPIEKSDDTLIRTSAPSYSYDGWKWDMVELNSADSAALDDLPGIGPYYAMQILKYRERLWGHFNDIHQLLEIRGIDSTVFAKMQSRIYIAPESIKLYDLYTVPADSLARHPYIGPFTAKGIERLRKLTPREEFSMDALLSNRIIYSQNARRISLYFR